MPRVEVELTQRAKRRRQLLAQAFDHGAGVHHAANETLHAARFSCPARS
jgi:hypothetical protein